MSSDTGPITSEQALDELWTWLREAHAGCIGEWEKYQRHGQEKSKPARHIRAEGGALAAVRHKMDMLRARIAPAPASLAPATADLLATLDAHAATLPAPVMHAANVLRGALAGQAETTPVPDATAVVEAARRAVTALDNGIWFERLLCLRDALAAYDAARAATTAGDAPATRSDQDSLHTGRYVAVLPGGVSVACWEPNVARAWLTLRQLAGKRDILNVYEIGRDVPQPQGFRAARGILRYPDGPPAPAPTVAPHAAPEPAGGDATGPTYTDAIPGVRIYRQRGVFPAEREARASTALDGETRMVPPEAADEQDMVPDGFPLNVSHQTVPAYAILGTIHPSNLPALALIDLIDERMNGTLKPATIAAEWGRRHGEKGVGDEGE